MASIDKVKVGETTYDVSPSKDGTLNNGYSSGDSVSPSEWSTVDSIASTDTNSSIFNKITTMVKNVRWLYTKLGTTDISSIGDGTVTGGLSSLYGDLSDKAELPHTHVVGDLPVTNDTQANSTTLIPSSAAIYSLYTTMSDLSTEISKLEELTSIPTDDPNTRYKSKDLGTWSTTSDVDTFLSQYNHDSNYSYRGTLLSLGNYVTIQDGTYNAVWEIAGFDMEHNQTAADGTTYDNGYGICMIPKTIVTSDKWTPYNMSISGSCIFSTIHTVTLPNIVTNLKNVLGTHVVNRNVLLSSSFGNKASNAYKWTTSDATLMSAGQLTGTFASHKNKYDDGEANYKLPLFNYEEYWNGSGFWLRGAYNLNKAWSVSGNDTINGYSTSSNYGVRPLIYIR